MTYRICWVGNPAVNRQLMYKSGLPPDTKYMVTLPVKNGMADIYHIKRTNDVFVIGWMNYRGKNVKRSYIDTSGYRKTNKHLKKLKTLSKRYDIPFYVCIILGTNEENYWAFLKVISKLDTVDRKIIEDLSSDGTHLKDCLKKVLGDLSSAVGIESMCQISLSNIASYIVKCYRKQQI